MPDMLALFLFLLTGTALTALTVFQGKRPERPLVWALVSVLISAVLGAAVLLFCRIRYGSGILSGTVPASPRLLVCMFVYLLLCALSGAVCGAVRSGGIRSYLSGPPRDGRIRGLLLAFFFIAAAASVFICIREILGISRTDVLLNEICCSNFSLAENPDGGDYDDYIELYNPGPGSVSLSDYLLSDSLSLKKACRLPDTVLEPGEYVLFFADGRKTGGSSLSFGLKTGETVCLFRSDGTLAGQAVLNESPADCSVSLAGKEYIITEGTPGGENCAVPVTVPSIGPPVFSVGGGFYRSAISVELSSSDSDEIYYTLDGSRPDRNGIRYTGPITVEDICGEANRVVSVKNVTASREGAVTSPVKKGTVIRAAAVDREGNIGKDSCEVYFVGDFSEFDGVKILNAVVDPDDLFGDSGICVTGPEYDAWLAEGSAGDEPVPNYMLQGRSSERQSVITLWDSDRKTEFTSSCGIRVQGHASRAYYFKRFSFYSRGIYSGSSVFPVPLFGDADISTHSFYLRSDNYDLVAQELLSGREVGGLDAEEVCFFLNGEFYTRTYMREKYDSRYFEEHYGIDRNDLLLISDSEPDIGGSEAGKTFEEFLSYVTSSDASDPEVYEKICGMMDIQSYIEFFAANIYFNNIDWSPYKNCKLWRTRSVSGENGYSDGRWRWLVYDIDAVGWATERLDIPPEDIDPFKVEQAYIEGKPHDPYSEMPIYRSLMRNPDFRNRFAMTMLDMINSDFAPAAVSAVLDRFSISDHWLWSSFPEKRPARAVELLAGALGLSGDTCEITLKQPAAGGIVLFGTLSTSAEHPVISGTYLTGLEASLEAVPEKGWRFAGWKGSVDSTDAVLTVPLSGENLVIEAVFERES